MSAGTETTELHFSCLCRGFNGSAKVPASKLPLPYSLCHCNICRHQTGLLCASYLTLPKESTDLVLKGPLKHYKSSDIVTRTFCTSCGANVYLEDSRLSGFDICTGVLERANGIAELRNHIFVPDTKDGGLSPWLPDISAWEEFSKESKQWPVGREKQTQVKIGTRSELHAYCQCKGVQFKITPPNEHSRDPLAASPDLLRKDVTESAAANEKHAAWWLCADDQKYLAGTCACRSCRLASGFDIQMWAFVPEVNLFQSNGDPFTFDIGTLAQYESSRGVYRHFCSTCGATVFWRSEARPMVIDVSVGLLDAEEGARAERWLQWKTDRVSFEEEGHNNNLISQIGAGLKQWGTA